MCIENENGENSAKRGKTKAHILHGLELVDVCSLCVDQFSDVLLSLDLIRLQALNNLEQTRRHILLV